MKRALLFLMMVFPLIAGAQNIRIGQLRSDSETQGRIIQADGNGSFEFADMAASGAIDSMRISGNTLEVYAGGSLTPYTADLSAYLDNTDAQKFDVATLVGTVLQLSISGDGEATKTIDLASLQDGTGTDDQIASEVPVVDANGYWTATDVEGVLDEIYPQLGGSSIATTDDLTEGSTNLYNQTHTGEVTGSTALTISNDVVDYDNVSSTLKGAATDNDGSWDFSANGIINASFSANTTVTFSNLQTRKDIWVKLTISNGATVTWPSYADTDGDAIDADATYRIYIACWNATASNEDVHVVVTKIE